MELLSRKEAKVISEKYKYQTETEDWVTDYMDHKETMKKHGFRVKNEKYIHGAKKTEAKVVTYVKYTSL